MDRHYDLTYLNQVFYGNETMVKEIVELFDAGSPIHARHDGMRQAKWAELHPVAHKLKSSVNMLGMSGLLPLVLDRTHEQIRREPHPASSARVGVDGVDGQCVPCRSKI